MWAAKFVAQIKPIVMESWNSGDFQTKPNAVSIAAKFAIAVASVHKYQNDETELWGCITEMLKWALKSQVGASNLIPMDPFEFCRLVANLSRRRESDHELWGMIAKVLVTLMNTKKLTEEDIMHVTRSLVNAKVRSDKLYGFIVRYLMAGVLKAKPQASKSLYVPIFFYFSLAKACPKLSEEPEFFQIMNSLLVMNVDKMTDKQCEICLDTWKHNPNFVYEETKAALS
eukprot:CAMPEP_0185567574 /NCGR_PEP_ID=MMETSP0434-20130131/806_1 /TAXON_ID=626734 ORGANISM="Favella taraikaensis, Strain Fe Narragansett Bay" /NCGR_SAMPLE_ID=MMETSP0434 /ASSEMBLY_ACC=CAM_ASM_000379 /LENGTH=227 /DNA_ID=CAMNT_0028181833 /DNA_START=952 /DNA_END=1634 /DNA_ORIENTATION=-